jgi:serine/threonine-protein kinase
MRTCSSCGESILSEARFCPSCGAKVVEGGPTADPVIGRILNEKYRVLSKLGSGSMGTVYLGEHITLQKKVALKILRPEFLAGDETLTRFQREGIAAGKFTHPNAIQIFDFDRADATHVDLAMEYIEGEDLGQYLRREGRTSLERAVALGRQILSALAEAHACGIVHRDLKPENIMVVHGPGEHPSIKVLDFGLSKLVHLPLGASLQTQPGRIMGTPLYMAPEQGVGDPVDHRSDLYSVGLILYEMVTGTRPFRCDSVVELISKQISEPVPALTDSHPQLFVPGRLEDVIRRALEKRKEDRYQTAQAMLDALEAVDLADPTPARALPKSRSPRQTIETAQRSPSFSRKGMWVVVALLAVLGFVVGGWKSGLFGGGAAPVPRASMKPLQERTPVEASYVSLLDEARRNLNAGETNGALARVGEARASVSLLSLAIYR